MRCFTVTRRVEPAICVSPTPYPHVGVGEQGRGRTYVRFPVGRRFAETLARSDGGLDPLVRASVIRTKEKGTLLLVEERVPDNRALALVDIEAGYRGNTVWTGARRGPCSQRGQPITHVCCPECGYLRANPGEIHPADKGWLWDRFPPPGVTVLAEGYAAQGDAGRMGGHAVRLLVMEPGAVFRVVRYGRLYGAPAECCVAWDGENLRLGTWDEIFPPVDEEEGECV